jgi:hypothetical protein
VQNAIFFRKHWIFVESAGFLKKYQIFSKRWILRKVPDFEQAPEFKTVPIVE